MGNPNGRNNERGSTAMKRLTTEEILQKSLQGTGQDPVALQDSLAQSVKTNPNIRVLRSHNTLFIYENLGNGSVQLVMETADNPRDLVAAIKDAARAMKIAGFHFGTFNLENPRILKALDMAGLSYKMISNNEVMLEF
jgi:hypothetical protein